MILLALVAIGFVASLLMGGRVERLAAVRFRHSYLILAALLVQVLIFGRWWQANVEPPMLSSAFYITSMLLLSIACWVNRHVPGILLLGLGLLLNATVILANGGHMPTSLEAMRAAGVIASDATFDSIRANNSSLIGENTPLWFLGDIMAVPARVPLANVFSIGDVIIGLGALAFLWLTMRQPGSTAPSDLESAPLVASPPDEIAQKGNKPD